MNTRFRSAWLGAVIAGVLLAAPAAAQTDELTDRDLAYRAARSEYDAALSAWAVVEKRWNDAVEEHAQARRAGNEQRTNAALVRALDLAQELDRLEKRVKDQRATTATARTALITALDRRIDGVTAQIGAARTAADRTRLSALLQDYDNQQSDLEAEARGQAQPVALEYYASIQYDPRDTPQTLGSKAQLLRSKAEQADSSIANIDRAIVAVQRQLQRSRNAKSLVAGVERYGDIQIPVGAPNRNGTPEDIRARPDSAGVARPEKTPQQQIQELRLLKTQMQEAKRQFLQRAEQFDSQARRIG